MFAYHVVDPDLRVEKISRKQVTAQNGETDFEKRDTDASPNWH